MCAKRKNKSLSGKAILSIMALSVAFVLIIHYCPQDFWGQIKPAFDNVIEKISESISSVESSSSKTPTKTEGSIEITTLNIGQADSILIQSNGKTALIDAGDNGSADYLVEHLTELGVKTIDLIIATHPHADHIGGLDKVIKSFEIGTVVMPNLPDNLIPSTRTYTDVLEEMVNKNLSITYAKPQDKYDLGNGAVITIIAPIIDISDLNEMSIVARLDFGESSFLFTGDMETESEKSILDAGANVDCDVLKVAHHGSKSSSSTEFLKAVSPKIAIISCGKDNDYGHPHKETMEKLNEIKAFFRTDINGDIKAITDGNAIKIYCDNGQTLEIFA